MPPIDPEAACGASDVKFQVKSDFQGQHLPEVGAGKAVVYFVETQKIDAINNITEKIALDGARVGASQGDSYFFATAEPGKTYYFRIRITGDGWAGYSFDLSKMNSDEARLLIARSPYSVSRAKK